MIRQAAEHLALADLSDGETVFDAINQQDERVWPLYTAYCWEIVRVILNVQSAMDVSCYVVGGGISAQDIVIEEIRRHYSQIQESLPLLNKLSRHRRFAPVNSKTTSIFWEHYTNSFLC